ncbi:HdeD family acid-resistance protein [Massilia atriviolacea]|uniref:HdeD family acid-resistance protein n=1 Tax=Massilia atriviolacea TaxID=2495579 RepID=A0A430HRN6_9BURK|nr:HdeD family acid-resistance protein [Massilia atriviolacea]RSZ60176.1 HdeD family acid-resistance protein [Massilia atriviolacea]
MNDTLLRNWWLLVARGAIAIVFGVLAIAWPAVTLLTLTALFAAFTLLGGAVWIVGAIKYRGMDRHWWMPMLLGIVSVAVGVLATFNPAITLLTLILLMGANAVVSGVLDIVIAVRVRKLIRGEWLLLLSGLVSIVFGLIVLLFPLGAGAVMLATLIGVYAILTGVLLLCLAVRVRSWSRSAGAGRASPAAGTG